jgi:hypothetical protein
VMFRVRHHRSSLSGRILSQFTSYENSFLTLTLILLMWRIWRAPNNASRCQMGFNLAFKGLKWLEFGTGGGGGEMVK